MRERKKKTIYLNRTGTLRSKCIESTTKEFRPCLRHLFFRFDLRNLIRAKTIHVVRPVLSLQGLMILEAFQKEDVSAYMGLNTAVNNSSAMTEPKYKQAVICEQEHSCTSFHSKTHLTSKYIYALSHTHKTRYAWPHTPNHVQSSNTHAATVCTQKHTDRSEM